MIFLQKIFILLRNRLPYTYKFRKVRNIYVKLYGKLCMYVCILEKHNGYYIIFNG